MKFSIDEISFFIEEHKLISISTFLILIILGFSGYSLLHKDIDASITPDMLENNVSEQEIVTNEKSINSTVEGEEVTDANENIENTDSESIETSEDLPDTGIQQNLTADEDDTELINSSNGSEATKKTSEQEIVENGATTSSDIIGIANKVSSDPNSESQNKSVDPDENDNKNGSTKNIDTSIEENVEEDVIESLKKSEEKILEKDKKLDVILNNFLNSKKVEEEKGTRSTSMSSSSTTSSGGGETSTSSSSTTSSGGGETSTSSSSTTSSGGDTPTGGGGPGETKTYVDDYENNNGEYDTGGGNYVPIKVFSIKTRSPIQPEPVTCPSGYSELGINSNIFDLTTLNLPYATGSNNIALTNEIVKVGVSDYYYKVFNVNGVKIGGVIYKIVNPDFDYYWSFTMCLDN